MHAYMHVCQTFITWSRDSQRKYFVVYPHENGVEKRYAERMSQRLAPVELAEFSFCFFFYARCRSLSQTPNHIFGVRILRKSGAATLEHRIVKPRYNEPRCNKIRDITN